MRGHVASTTCTTYRDVKNTKYITILRKFVFSKQTNFNIESVWRRHCFLSSTHAQLHCVVQHTCAGTCYARTCTVCSVLHVLRQGTGHGGRTSWSVAGSSVWLCVNGTNDAAPSASRAARVPWWPATRAAVRLELPEVEVWREWSAAGAVMEGSGFPRISATALSPTQGGSVQLVGKIYVVKCFQLNTMCLSWHGNILLSIDTLNMLRLDKIFKDHQIPARVPWWQVFVFVFVLHSLCL